MKKRIRSITMILIHIGMLLSILYLLFYIICTVKAQNADASTLESDRYLSQAISEHDFSVYTVGSALSKTNDPAKETFFVIVDLIIPVLFLVSGILLQIAVLSKRRKHAAISSQSNHKQPISGGKYESFRS